ncbi:MAG: putative proteasome-type protease, partial [Mycobacterium sp.]|nr:putative proteasome-type protease [Mycobacterium sp.]
MLTCVRRELLVSEDKSAGAVTGPQTSSVGLVLAKASGRDQIRIWTAHPARQPPTSSWWHCGRGSIAQKAQRVTYCVGVILEKGMIFASDSRTNAGVDNFAKFCKMTVFERRGNRV